MAADTTNNLPPLPAEQPNVPEENTQEDLVSKKKGEEDEELDPTPFFNYVVIGFAFVFGLAIMAMIIVALVSSL